MQNIRLQSSQKVRPRLSFAAEVLTNADVLSRALYGAVLALMLRTEHFEMCNFWYATRL